MVREKRKNRLNKEQGSGEFVGFAAFAAPAAASSSTSLSNISSTSASLSSLAPVYTGSDSAMSMLFPRIGQKRDATTKAKALGELKDYFADDSKPKKHQVDALSHFCYLYHSKLHYDNTARVRAASIECLQQAFVRLPKAFKTLCEQQQPEILGMIFCSRADPAADARVAANQLVESMAGTIDFSDGVWDYVKRIISYGKPKAMHEEVFQKKETSTALSERQLEELDERYERIVGTAIVGMQYYIQQHFSNNDNVPPEGDVRFLWKSIAGPKASLRRKTYSLLATACQMAPLLIDSDKTSKLLLQALSAEKDPSNIPSLLETLISFVAYYPQEQRSETMAIYKKSLSKLFKKGCLGATQWGPTVLPIVAILPQEDQPFILTCIWEGRTHLAGLAEMLDVVAAVAETATFLLLKSHHDFSEVIAKCWLQSVQMYLTTQGTGPAQKSLEKLCNTLARDLNQLNQASHSKTSSSIFHLRDWFWNEELPKVVLQDNVDNQQLLMLLSQLESSKDAEIPNYWVLMFKSKFHKLLETCQGNSGLVPSVDVYELWIAILNCLGVDQVFEKSMIDKFIMNDVLRWMIIHTSSVSDQANEKLARIDFSIFQLCWPLANTGIWDSILRELVAAKCNLQHLDAGLHVMLKNGEPAKRLQSPSLEKLCIDVAKEAVELMGPAVEEDSDASELEQEHNKIISRFLKTCCGLGDYEALVGSPTIQTLVDFTCPSESLANIGPNSVLEALVLFAKVKGLDESSLHRIILQSWRQGGLLWHQDLAPWLTENDALKVKLVDLASEEVKDILCHGSSDSKKDEEVSQIWAERVCRLLWLCKSDERNILPQPRLSLIGLDDSKLWKENEGKSAQSFVTQCLIKVIHNLDSVEDRRSLFSDFQSETLDLFINILISLSGANTDFLKATPARQRKDTCSMLLKEIGASLMDGAQIETWCKACISLLVSLFKSDSDERICRGIAVLSQLVELVFRRLGTELDIDDKLQLNKIQKGDTVWYISDPKETSIREECTVVKIHTDLPGEVYFTIKVSRDGVVQERQTLAERLRRGPNNFNVKDAELISINDIPSQEVITRGRFTKMIIDESILPFWDENWGPYAYELLCLVISQCGLLGKRGIGSEHHLIFQKLLKVHGTLIEALDDTNQNKGNIAAMLFDLSLALGYGCNIPSSSSQLLISFDPADSVKKLVNYYAEIDADSDTDFDFAVARWLTVSVTSMDNSEMRDQAYMLLFRLSAQLFESDSQSLGFSSKHLGALKAMKVAQKVSHSFKSGESLLEDSEAEALAGMVKAFAIYWEDCSKLEDFSPSDPDPVWNSISIVGDVFESSFSHRQPLMASASRPCINKLIECLYTDSKQRYSMKLLNAYANEGVPLHSEPTEDAINDLTAEKIQQWCKDLIEEECDELEDDVDVVAQWIPQKLMNDIESWYEIDNDYVPDANTTCGRFLSWIVFLQIVEVSAGKEAMNRPSFASYVTKCKAVETMLSLAIDYGNVGSERKVKFEKVTEIDRVLESNDETKMSRLSAFVIFRTIEVFPTIAKNWWEMVCPKYSTQAIRDFVETSVSPEILRRELDRIKEATSFGEMKVKGSSMSREVTATYMQDDFLLSVVIKLPLSFPFRRAEVDCSKTFGIPESRWKRWALQITQMLNNQGGTLNDALVLWKENVDKEFEGVEPCPVCYSVLHVKTHKLPGVECNTCHNCFHIDCLSQWFRSSGKNDCVLCQQPWSGTRVP